MQISEALEPNPLEAEPGCGYVKIQTLGQGSFGFVQLARHSSGELTAIKFLKRGAINKYTEAEILNHSLLRHPHVIQFKEVFLTPEYICIAMEYATGSSLFNYVQKQGRLKEAVARWFFQQLIIGADYCHKKGVANRDIKLENTLLQVVAGLPLPLLKICDFGYSKADCMSVAKSKVGTLTYMAPEVLVNRDGKYNGKVADIWSCGVMLYVMLFGRYPFDTPPGQNVPKANELMGMLEKMVGMKYTLEGIELSPEGRDLLKRMLLPDPSARIQLEQIMVHPWFTANLPPEATTMNECYLRAALPQGHQPVEQIRQLLEQAKESGPSHAQTAAAAAHKTNGAMDDSFDANIENAIKEDMQEFGGSGSMMLHQFIQQHGSGQQGGPGR